MPGTATEAGPMWNTWSAPPKGTVNELSSSGSSARPRGPRPGTATKKSSRAVSPAGALVSRKPPAPGPVSGLSATAAGERGGADGVDRAPAARERLGPRPRGQAVAGRDGPDGSVGRGPLRRVLRLVAARARPADDAGRTPGRARARAPTSTSKTRARAAAATAPSPPPPPPSLGAAG